MKILKVILLLVLAGCTKIEYIPVEIIKTDTIYVVKEEPEPPIIVISFDSIADYDGNYYRMVNIGDQSWFNKNLLTTHYNNGNGISTTSILSDVTKEVAPKYQFGERCYTWFVVNDSRGICPVGSRVAGREDWDILALYLADHGYGNTISKDNVSKSIASKTGWLASFIPGTVGYEPEKNNITGFNMEPSVMMSPESFGISVGVHGSRSTLWTSTKMGDNLDNRAIAKMIYFEHSWITTCDYPKNWGFSVRCIKNK